jgi:hypothetical protein
VGDGAMSFGFIFGLLRLIQICLLNIPELCFEIDGALGWRKFDCITQQIRQRLDNTIGICIHNG